MLYFRSSLKEGPVAEWLGRALQKLLHQFESGRDLVKRKSRLNRRLFLLNAVSAAADRQRSAKAPAQFEWGRELFSGMIPIAEAE